jgi:tRNA (cmo5U34)-methyltransferase
MEEETKLKDQVIPEDKWRFDEGVTKVFDDMLSRSIPQYEVMRDAVFELGSKFVKDGTHVVDLGCSRGEALSNFVSRFGARCRFLGVEVSEPMLEAARARFAGWNETVRIEKMDLRKEYPQPRASLTLCVLTAMFVPIEHRPALFRAMHNHSAPGGAVVLVEKVLGEGAENDAAFVELYLRMKKDNGYTDEQVERKRLSLEGVLVPLTARWNEEMLRWAGFQRVECFWRWMNFCGWLGVKP